ncbi:hypothetical protein GCM10009615_09970 [Corynebacterium durum]
MGTWWNLSLMCRGECKNCGNLIPSGNKFCGECGCSVESGSTNMANAGGDIHGGLYQAGRDIVVNSSKPSESVEASYEAVPKWRSPVTLGVLTWVSIGLGVLAFFPIRDILKPVFGFLFSFPRDYEVEGYQYYNSRLIFILAIIVLAVPIMLLLNIARNQIRKPLCFSWAINGAGKRLTLEWIRPNSCPICGGKMRYCKNLDRMPILLCSRNSNHWFEVDQAEDVIDDSR